MKSIILFLETSMPKYLYRSGSTQNIKLFNGKILNSTHDIKYKNIPLIYATDDISYAAGFCFEWSDSDGFDYGKINNQNWILRIPKRYQNKLNVKCSMYYLDTTNFTKIKKISTPEYLSDQSAKVLKEIKFNTCWDCLDKYKVKVILI